MGSTGSIGTRTLQVVSHLEDELEIVALAAKSNVELLFQQAVRYRPKIIACFEEEKALALRKKLPHIPIVSGVEGLSEIACFSEADFVMLAMSGSMGLLPAISAIKAQKQIGLANKEVMISAGELIANLAREKKVQILPVDSEHSTLFQCLLNEDRKKVRRLILTASGGPFREKSEEELKRVGLQEAMTHPNFSMGAKVTIDSSTLMNKGLEMIEARWLFDIEPERIEAIIHPEQRVHSFVEFIDGSMKALFSEPDMLFPIQYALTYPIRKQGILPPYDFQKNRTLSFYPPDPKKFLCLQLAIESMRLGKSYPCFLNAANEVLVEKFLRKEISWIEIGQKLEKLISSHDPQNLLTLEATIEIDLAARRKARQF